MKLIRLILMGSTPADDKVLLVNPSHILCVREEQDHSNRREVICFIKMIGGETFAVRNGSDYIHREANKVNQY